MLTKLLLAGGALLAVGVAGYHVRGYVAYIEPTQNSASSAEAKPDPAPFVDTTNPNDLLPDLLPLPAQDLTLEKTSDGRTLLRFSTTYYNQGRGPAELRGDPKTAGIRADLERNVLQRIHTADGEYRDKVVGTFLWHQEHLHYHFADFISYDLESLDSPEHPELEGMLVKSTYCLRDVSRVHVNVPNIPEEAGYKICGKELQGVSVGWGDTYYYNYPGQVLDVTSLASGRYKLTFVANPEMRLEEIRYDNNQSYTIFMLDTKHATVTSLETYPASTPTIEHIHLDDPFGVTPQYPQ